jgi:hypothetical protein
MVLEGRFPPPGHFHERISESSRKSRSYSDCARLLTEDSRHPRVELVNKAAAFEVPDVDGA